MIQIGFVYLYLQKQGANTDKQRVFSHSANADIQKYRSFAHSERGERERENGYLAKMLTKQKAATASVYGMLVVASPST